MYSLDDLQRLSEVTSTHQRFATDAQHAGSSNDISLRGLSLAFGPLTILQDAQIRLTYGTKYALVGRNGIGKTTLLRCMANNLIPQWTNIRTFLVQQEYSVHDPRLPGETPLAMVQHSDVDHQALLRAIEEAEDGNSDLGALYEQLSLYDESEMERRAVEILENLKFSKDQMTRPLRELSGGWRMRTWLACAVFARPQLLLLDEPTNHLDLTSIRWLVDYIKSLECTAIVVSHDQDFLDQITDCVIHLTQKQLRYYPGDFSVFQQVRQDKLNEQSNRDKRRRQAAGSGDTRKAKELEAPQIAKISKKNLVDTAWVWGPEALIVGAEGEDDKHHVLRFPDPDASVTDPIVQLKAVTFAWPGSDKNLFDNVDLSIDRCSRIAILGKNGIGKSTLLRCMAGLESPKQGMISRHHNLRVAVFTQHLVQDIDLTKTPLELLSDMFPRLKTQEARDYLGSFGISGDRALTPLRVLSGGQRTRFVFSMLMFEQPHLLLLDEPTSHLDMEMTEALIAAIATFKGAVVLVSHHRYFLRKLNCEFYYLRRKMLTPIATIEEYLNTTPLRAVTDVPRRRNMAPLAHYLL